mmetsp:Transcript_34581/g.79955  ORF Transcript_34581/g.79955 Transcript_34581/m.79955 type:complete len:115 (-) Transcript_34581:99-443(-)
MKKIERAEEKQTRIEPKKQIFHSCIVNIVIGTLYCEKGNYEFGISRIMKSMEPFEKKLGVDTWFHTKREVNQNEHAEKNYEKNRESGRKTDKNRTEETNLSQLYCEHCNWDFIL